MMKKTGCAVLLMIAMMCTGSLALAENPTALNAAAEHPAKITVQGTAQVKADPDQVTVTANTSVTAGTVGSAQEEMNKIVEKATAMLLELGVEDDDIVTNNYSYYPKYNYETNTLIGYEANHTLAITCRDVEMLDSVIGVLTDSGFSQIYSVQYDVSNRNELYQQAMDLAIQRAEEKAVRMAQTSGMALTGLESLSENSGYNEGYHVNAMADMAMAKSESAATGIRAGSVAVSASVTAVYTADAQ